MGEAPRAHFVKKRFWFLHLLLLSRPCILHEIAVRKLMRKVDVVILRKETADSVDVWAVAHHFH